MHNTAASEVNGSRVKKKVGHVEGRQPAVGSPHPMCHHRVDKTGEEGGVDEVRGELSALCNGAGRDASCCDRESPLQALRRRRGRLLDDIKYSVKIHMR